MARLIPLCRHIFFHATTVAVAFFSLALSPALAQSALDKAAEAARTIDTVRGAIISAIQHGEGRQGALILENTSDWVPAYNKFAKGEDALLLRRYADERHHALSARRVSLAAYKREACPRLRPLVAVAASAERVAGAGGRADKGHVLRACRKKLCIPVSIRAAGERCDFEPFATPIQPS